MEKRQTVGSLLVEYGKITEADLQEALAHQQETGRRLGEVLIDAGKITRQDIEWILSKQLDIPFIIVDEASIDTNLLYTLPKDFLLQNRILPMYETDEEIAIVTDDPFNSEAFRSIEHHRGKKMHLSAGDGEAIECLLKKLLRKEGATELVAVLEGIISQLRETCFYRLDFLNSNDGLKINAFGFGMMRNMYSAEMSYTAEDVMKSLDAMDVHYLYDHMENPDGTGYMMNVYVVESIIDPPSYPAVLGCFGLGLPEGAMLSDIRAVGLSDVFLGKSPVRGYPYFYSRPVDGHIKMALMLMDNAPKDFKNFYVKVNVPVKCPSCKGPGCDECGRLGFVFSKLDGMYSYSDILKILKEGQ